MPHFCIRVKFAANPFNNSQVSLLPKPILSHFKMAAAVYRLRFLANVSFDA